MTLSGSRIGRHWAANTFDLARSRRTRELENAVAQVRRLTLHLSAPHPAIWVEMDFNVRPVGKICAISGQELPVGDPCWSVLIERDGRIVRQDYSDESWSGPPDGVIGYWQSVVPDRTAGAVATLDTSSLFEYFVQLCESPNKVELDYQYVLALLLMRKRRLILEESIIVDDHPGMRLIGASGEGPFEVLERDLPESRIEELQNQLFSGSAA